MLLVYSIAVWIVLLMFLGVGISLVFFILSLIFGLKIKNRARKITVLCLSGTTGLLFTCSVILFMIIGYVGSSNATTVLVYLWMWASLFSFATGVVAFVLSLVFKRKYGRIKEQAPVPVEENKPIEVKVVPNEPNKDYIEELKQLKELHDNGILTDEEFVKAKEKIIG